MAKPSKKQKATGREARRKGPQPEAAKQTKKQIAFSRKQARQNRIIWLSVGGLVLLILVVLAFAVAQELVLKPGQPVAYVNGTAIRLDDFQDLLVYRRYNLHAQELNVQNSLNTMDPNDEANQFIVSFYQQQLAQIQSALATAPQDAVDELVGDELIRGKAEELHLSITDADVEEALFPTQQEPITSTEGAPTPVPREELDARYSRLLSDLGMSDKRFRALVKRNLLREKLQETLADQVPTTGPLIYLHLIATETEEQALAAKERIESGEDFALVAQEVYSETSSTEFDGDVGWVTTGQLSEQYGQELETLAFSLEIGKIGYTESAGQFLVLMVSDKDENGPLPQEVLTGRQNSALTDWLDERKASPDVVIENILQPSQIPPDPFATQSVAP